MWGVLDLSVPSLTLDFSFSDIVLLPQFVKVM